MVTSDGHSIPYTRNTTCAFTIVDVEADRGQFTSDSCGISVVLFRYNSVYLHTVKYICAFHSSRLHLQVDVCDKVEVSSRDPSLDASYYSTFSYTLLSGSGEVVSFDSTPAKDPTGEVQVRVNNGRVRV